jgi:hypothetical protein
LEGASVGSNIFMDDGFRAEGEVRCIAASFEGLQCQGGTFLKPGGVALYLDAVRCSLVVLGRHFEANGTVRFPDATIRVLDCNGGTFSNHGGIALLGDRSQVSGTVFFGWGFVAYGEVRLFNAQVGDLTCVSGTFHNASGYALSCEGITVTGTAFLSGSFAAFGEVSMVNATLQQFECRGGTFVNRAGIALSLFAAQVARTLLIDGCAIDGSLIVHDATVGSMEVMAGCIGAGAEAALVADRLKVGADLLLRDVAVNGTLRLSGAQVDGSLRCIGVTLRAPQGAALEADGSAIAATFQWRPREVSGSINLNGASVGELDDDLSCYAATPRLQLSGLTYGRFSENADTSWLARLEWVRRQGDYVPQPYEELISAYRRSGLDEVARKIAVAKHEDRRRLGGLSRWARGWNWLLGILIGHGYKPWRPALVLLALYLVTLLVVSVAKTNDAFIPTRAQDLSVVTVPAGDSEPPVARHRPVASQCNPGYRCFSAPAYSLENVVPLLNLRQSENWQPEVTQRWGWFLGLELYVAAIFGWVFSTLSVAALTGLIRKD